MKTAQLVRLLVLAGALSGLQAFAGEPLGSARVGQGTTNLVLGRLAPLSPQPQVFVLNPAHTSQTNGLVLTNNCPPGTPLQKPPKDVLVGRGALPNLPAPGVYESSPYTCIVVVPGSHPDDRSIIGSDRDQPRMPMVTPDLKLIPRKAK